MTGEAVQTQEIGRLATDGSYQALPRAVTSFVGAVKSFNEESSPEGPTLCISGEYGVARVDLAHSQQVRPELNLYLREGTTVTGKPLPLPRDGRSLELPFGNRDIRLRFATDDYDESDEVRYRTKLDGLNSDWTPFFSEPTWQSGSLGEGRYRLHVVARNSEGTDSNEFSLAINVLPPVVPHTLDVRCLFRGRRAGCFRSNSLAAVANAGERKGAGGDGRPVDPGIASE